MGDNTIVNEKSCVGSIACEYMGNDVIVNENSCVGEQACNKLIGTGENSTDIGENSW
jgi:ferredoxin